jgi:ABC-type lipoprotein release transport system permease subunit
MLKMAWRNLWRNRRRTVITLVSIAFGVLLCVTFTSLNDSSYDKMIELSTRMGLGHVSIQPKGYLAAPSLKLRLSGIAGLRQQALAMPGVAAALPRLQGPALFATAARSVGGFFVAVDPALESPANNTLLRCLVEGRLFSSSDEAGVVVGARMAEKLKLKLGKKMVVTVSDIHGEMASTLVRVTGIYRTGVDEVDGMTLLLPMGTMAALLGYGPDEATAVSVLLSDHRQSGALAVQLEAGLGRTDTEVLPWTLTQANLADMIKVDSISGGFVQLILAVMIAMGVLNTVLMSVIERQREFGIMLALGLSPARLMGLVLAEGFWIGLLGLAAGVAVTWPWYAYLRDHGLDLTRFLPPGGLEVGGVMLEPIYHGLLYPDRAALIAAGAVGLVLLASAYPAWRAGRVPPMEAIRNG